MTQVCIAGKNSIAVHGLKLALSQLDPESVLVCTNKSDDGSSGWQPSLKRFAEEYGVSQVSLEDLYAIPELVFISLEFDRLIKPECFLSRRLFNMHFSKLPAYKGVYTSAWPILNGDTESGVTLHRIDSGIDTGEIISQLAFPLEKNETARTLYFKYLEKSKELLDQDFSDLIAGNFSSIPQSASNSSYYSKTSIAYENLKIDLRQTAVSIARQVRAYSFREFQVPTVYGLPVGGAEVLGERSRGEPGKLIARESDEIILASIDYNVRLKRDRSFELFGLVESRDAVAIRKSDTAEAFVDVANRKGWTPLMVAAFSGDVEVCQALLDIGASVNLANQNGTTPLMFAKDFCEKNGSFALCDLLIAAGADVRQVDEFGRDVLGYAVMNKQKAAIDYFRGFGFERQE